MPYDNRYRKFKALCKELAEEPAQEQVRLPKSRKERRRIAREKLLPADRICEECGNYVPNSRSWVVKDNEVMCLRCYRNAT